MRTKNDNLPIYTDFKNGRTKEVTILRKYKGDVGALKEELAILLPQVEIQEKVGRIEIAGLHRDKLVHWLKTLGY